MQGTCQPAPGAGARPDTPSAGEEWHGLRRPLQKLHSRAPNLDTG